MCFRFELCIPSYSGRSSGVPFVRSVVVRLIVLPLQGFEFTYPIFEISMTLRTRSPDVFHHLVPNDNFQCQTPLKNAKFDLFGSENVSCQIWIESGLLWQSYSGYGMHFAAILSNYNGMTAYICRRFIPTTAFLVMNNFGRRLCVKYRHWF